MPVLFGRPLFTHLLALELPHTFCAFLSHRCKDEKGGEYLGTPVRGQKEMQIAETFRGLSALLWKLNWLLVFLLLIQKPHLTFMCKKKSQLYPHTSCQWEEKWGDNDLSPRSDNELERLWMLIDMLKNAEAISDRRWFHHLTQFPFPGP